MDIKITNGNSEIELTDEGIELVAENIIVDEDSNIKTKRR